MNLLRDGVAAGTVVPTDRATKLVVDGLTETYPIYQVRLDQLYYNDQNDRIATWISQYNADHGEDALSHAEREHYNEVIHSFITRSNPERLRQTQTNIGLFGQQKHGVVLNDGRIIDGNRRYTCLRNLAKKDPRFQYFETVILDRDFENSLKQIKMLELQIQIGEESRVDYNPIDRLAGIYRDIDARQLLTVEEYARSTNQTPRDVENQLRISRLLVEFLEAINAPGQFYIAREMDLSGPLQELDTILRKIRDEDRRQEVKYIVFTNFLMRPAGDMTRFIRNLKKVAASNYLDEFIDREIDIAEEVLDGMPEPGKVTTEVIAQLRTDEETRQELEQTMELVNYKARATETRNRPNQIVSRAVDSLDAIDRRVIRLLTPEQQEDLREKLDQLDQLARDLRKSLPERSGEDIF